MTVLAQEFMEKFGYGNQPYIVWLHEDIKRKHMHIVSVRINEQGEKIDHNREAIRAQNICREMEVKYSSHTRRTWRAGTGKSAKGGLSER